ncbi:MAG: DUF91 domain-containing protein [Phycisphaerae bacterium]|nr:DUF91 domain-containing protein [Phycisphaerae bacterium]
MTTHVFIVDAITFKVHLEYLFAGTGAKENHVDFNNGPNTRHRAVTENMLTSMIADASRIRRGDQIIFYLQQNFSHGIREGKFYGIFTAKHDWSFLDDYDGQQYLFDSLQKSLTFRTLIEPSTVYQQGVTEWEALDEIRNIACPHQMLWSLIYRKLKGNRGNTMITLYESERLCQLIRNKNHRTTLGSSDGNSLSFDQGTQTIIVIERAQQEYGGRQEPINILPRLINKYENGLSFEAHLQAYICKNIGSDINISLNNSLLQSNSNIEWIGNEVSCGVGMQRIDIMLALIVNGQRQIMPIELKAVEASEDNVRQIKRYVDWIEQYYIPNRHSDILPVLVAKRTANRGRSQYRNVLRAIDDFNKDYAQRCCNLRYVEYHLENNNLKFEIIQ